MIQALMRDQREAERRYPVRVCVAVPPEGLGRQLEIMHAWLDEACGAGGWATAPAGMTGVVNDALALYFEDSALARAFVARFCCGFRVETIAGAFAVRSDARSAGRSGSAHKSP
jgi:hypothetical protein